MVLRFTLDRLPTVAKIYHVTRRTVWQIADPFHILLVIVSGSCTVTIGRETETLCPGDVMWIPADTSYIRRPVGDELCTMFYVHFTLPVTQMPEKAAREELLERTRKLEEEILSDESPADWNTPQNGVLFAARKISLGEGAENMYALLERSEHCARTNLITVGARRSIAAVRLLVAVAEASVPKILEDSPPTAHRNAPTKLARAVWFIRQHYAEKITLTDVCEYCAVSRQQMIRYFRESLGTTPNAYIIQYKMDKAREMLASFPNMTVKEVAQELGFEDQGYFSRVFTRVVGESPTSYRSRVVQFDERKHITETLGTINAETAGTDLPADQTGPLTGS